MILGAQEFGYQEGPSWLYPDCPKIVEDSRQTFQIEYIFIHPNYNSSQFNRSHDVALLKLPTPAELNTYVNTACLPEGDEHIQNGTNVVRTGWGNRGRLGPYEELRQVVVPFIEQSECRNAENWKYFDDTMMCTGKVPQGSFAQQHGYCEVKISIFPRCLSKV